MVNLVDNARFLYVVISVLLVQAITLISRKFIPRSKFSEKKDTHWTTNSFIFCQVFMILTAAWEAIKFDANVGTTNYVGLFILMVVLIITHTSYDTLGEYYSPKIEVKKKHKLIDTGIYGLIRHPMDLASLLFMISVPLSAGSYFAFVWLIPFCVVLSFKIKYEEKILIEGLRGYKAYMKRTKRLIPWIL